MAERETKDFLDLEVSQVVLSLKELGVVVSGVIADNAKNIQAGLRCFASLLFSFQIASTFQAGFTCRFHCGQLLLPYSESAFEGPCKFVSGAV